MIQTTQVFVYHFTVPDELFLLLFLLLADCSCEPLAGPEPVGEGQLTEVLNFRFNPITVGVGSVVAIFVEMFLFLVAF
jgi:hypothetical protein